MYQAAAGGEDFYFLDFNRAAEKITSRLRDEVVGKSVLEVFPGVRESGIFDILKQVWATGRARRSIRWCITFDDRVNLWVENSVYKLPSGEIVFGLQ